MCVFVWRARLRSRFFLPSLPPSLPPSLSACMHTCLRTPQGYVRNEYPDEDEGEDALDEDDFDHSLSGGMYAKAAWREGDSDGEDESSDEEQRWRPQGLRRFAFDQVCSRGVFVDEGSGVV